MLRRMNWPELRPQVSYVRLLMTLPLLSLVVGCASSSVPLNSTVPAEETERFIRDYSSEDVREVGVIFVLFEGDAYYPDTLWINGEKLGSARQGILRLPLLPGRYVLRYKVEETDSPPRELVFNIQKGEVRYFQDEESTVWKSKYTEVTEAGFEEAKVWRIEKPILPSLPRSAYLPDVEARLLDECLTRQTLNACDKANEAIPAVLLEPETRKRIASIINEGQAQIASEEARKAFEATLPQSVLVDKYTLALRDALANRNYDESITYFERLQSLDVPLDPDFDFFYGEALYETGKPEEALAVTSRYLRTRGQGANFYQDALQLLNKIQTVMP
jgi:tetratricopeptide (TPR) repeat protein